MRLVHGDPTFARIEESFPLAARIADKVPLYRPCRAARALPAPDRHDITVSRPGRRVGGPTDPLRHRGAGYAAGRSGLVRADGPNLPQPEYDTIAAMAGPRLTWNVSARIWPG